MTYIEIEKYVGKFVSIEYEWTTGDNTFNAYIQSVTYQGDRGTPSYVVFVIANFDGGYMKAVLGLDSIKSIEQLSQTDELLLKLKFDL